MNGIANGVCRGEHLTPEISGSSTARSRENRPAACGTLLLDKFHSSLTGMYLLHGFPRGQGGGTVEAQ